jgi:hypothetical protein
LETLIVVGVGVVPPLGTGLSCDTVTDTPVSRLPNVFVAELAVFPLPRSSFASWAAVVTENA